MLPKDVAEIDIYDNKKYKRYKKYKIITNKFVILQIINELGETIKPTKELEQIINTLLTKLKNNADKDMYYIFNIKKISNQYSGGGIMATTNIYIIYIIIGLLIICFAVRLCSRFNNLGFFRRI